jgi:hypothetical protein
MGLAKEALGRDGLRRAMPPKIGLWTFAASTPHSSAAHTLAVSGGSGVSHHETLCANSIGAKKWGWASTVCFLAPGGGRPETARIIQQLQICLN